jgi:hypothetical protein
MRHRRQERRRRRTYHSRETSANRAVLCGPPWMIVTRPVLRIHYQMVTVAAGFDLQGCQAALAGIETDLNQLASTLTEDQFQAPPRKGGWSVGYCVEHLILTGYAFLSKWDTALEVCSVKRSSADGPFQYASWQRFILYFIEPPYRLKTKTSQRFVPCSRRSKEETVAQFLQMHQEFIRRMENTHELDLRRTKMQSPFTSWIQYPLDLSIDLALAHERRHLWQARQVRAQLLGQR